MSQQQMGMQKKRPLGVTILAILAIIIGIFSIIGGIALIGLSVIGGIFGLAIPAGWGILYGVAALILGFISLVAGGGLLTLRMWAWWLLLIVGIAQIVIYGLGLNWVTVALWAIIVIYLILVRKAFVRGPAQPSMA